MRAASRPDQATFAVVGCSKCDALWIVETDKRRERTCPGCGQRYPPDTRPRRRLSRHDTLADAQVARSRMLGDRYGAADFDIDADPHTTDANAARWSR